MVQGWGGCGWYKSGGGMKSEEHENMDVMGIGEDGRGGDGGGGDGGGETCFYKYNLLKLKMTLFLKAV